MRSFIIACIILLSIIALIVTNTIYTRSKIDDMLVICHELKKNSSPEKAKELFAFWQSCRKVVALSVHNSKIEEIDSAVMALNSYYDNTESFSFALSILFDAFMHIKESQSLTAENIF